MWFSKCHYSNSNTPSFWYSWEAPDDDSTIYGMVCAMHIPSFSYNLSSESKTQCLFLSLSFSVSLSFSLYAKLNKQILKNHPLYFFHFEMCWRWDVVFWHLGTIGMILLLNLNMVPLQYYKHFLSCHRPTL